MNTKQCKKIIQITNQTYELIGGDFAKTRNRPWLEMEVLVNKYIKNGQKVLDLGCGGGRILDTLKNKQIDYLGIDKSELLLKEARGRLNSWEIKQMGRVNFKSGNMLELDKLKEKDFDVVLMFASFNHLPCESLRLKVLKDIKKLLKPAGLLIMTNWNLWQWGAKKSVWQYKFWRSVHGEKFKTQDLSDIKEWLGFKDVMTFWQSRDKQKSGGLYYRALNKAELKKLFKQAGYKIIENYYSLNGGKSHWWKARNIVFVVRG